MLDSDRGCNSVAAEMILSDKVSLSVQLLDIHSDDAFEWMFVEDGMEKMSFFCCLLIL